MTEPAPRERVVDSPKIWTTLLTNTKYLSGLLTLDYSLKAVGSKYPLLALYTNGLTPDGHAALDARGIKKQRIEYLIPKVENDYSNDVRFYDCWSKLQPFGLTEYERVVQLDSDMLVLKNMDELMDLPLDINSDRVFAASHACVCNPLNCEHYPKDWIPENCGYTSQHDDPDSAAETGASSTFGLGILNGGLQVVNPNMGLYNKILKTIQTPDKTVDYAFSDQSLLSDIFKGRWVPLSYKYNALKTLRWCHNHIWRDDEVKNVHYILTPKPWDQRESEDPTHEWWWESNNKRHKEEKEKGIADGW
ncbi:nucleotide-diphospho-sugar transferase [Trichophaea hybrida]|nr:nucleotide-diphospho-sugar transferase [Trichophaea hybrida]